MPAHVLNKLFAIAVVLLLCSCATGSAIVTGVARPPINASDVLLYTETPKNYEVIGIVKASSDAGWSEQKSIDYAIGELKNQAAKLGANGVLITNTAANNYSIVSSNPGGGVYSIPVSEQVISGKAIYVTD